VRSAQPALPDICHEVLGVDIEEGKCATLQLRPLLAERGVALSREQIYRLVTGARAAEPSHAGRRAATGSAPLPRPVRAWMSDAAHGSGRDRRSPSEHELGLAAERPGPAAGGEKLAAATDPIAGR
jgi:hypothetical protein